VERASGYEVVDLSGCRAEAVHRPPASAEVGPPVVGRLEPEHPGRVLVVNAEAERDRRVEALAEADVGEYRLPAGCDHPEA
jgi:hypothetical protein